MNNQRIPNVQAWMSGLARQFGIPLKKIQAIWNAGFLPDLLGTEDLTAVDRNELRRVLGYDPFVFSVKMGGPETTDQVVAILRENGITVNAYIAQEYFPLVPSETPWEDEIKIIDPRKSFSEAEGLAFLTEEELDRPTYGHAIRFFNQYGVLRDMRVVFLHDEPQQSPFQNRRVLYSYNNLARSGIELDYPGHRFSQDCLLAGVIRKQPSSLA